MPRKLTKFGLDSSCVIPLLSAWHEFHSPTLGDYQNRIRRREHPVVPLHALIESYSVLTRLPTPLRVPPAVALEQLAGTFQDKAEVPGITSGAGWKTLIDSASRGIGGGTVYDALIARAVSDAGATLILTWNVRDMVRVAPAGLVVARPGEA